MTTRARPNLEETRRSVSGRQGPHHMINRDWRVRIESIHDLNDQLRLLGQTRWNHPGSLFFHLLFDGRPLPLGLRLHLALLALLNLHPLSARLSLRFVAINPGTDTPLSGFCIAITRGSVRPASFIVRWPSQWLPFLLDPFWFPSLDACLLFLFVSLSAFIVFLPSPSASPYGVNAGAAVDEVRRCQRRRGAARRPTKIRRRHLFVERPRHHLFFYRSYTPTDSSSSAT